MPKGVKTKERRTFSHTFYPKDKPKVEKPKAYESNPIFDPFGPTFAGNSRYFYTGLWMAFMVGLAQGQDISRFVEQALAYPGQANPDCNGGTAAEDGSCGGQNPTLEPEQAIQVPVSATQTASVRSMPSAAAAKPLVFSQHARATVHPGLYMMKSGITSRIEHGDKMFDKITDLARKKDPVGVELGTIWLAEEGRLNNDNPRVSLVNQEVRATLEIDTHLY